ncbi:hypothetical protein K435DRAFT_869584 [Dendrothele bispora CBS 962.96]|uniref:Heterokaryon incompatibility domain-containing protein n=1 Tax=Dendrothele bispora (strain CBS 962.96) TaxID=1314807 RepID=A0A4S8L990_DENBC|nr:hypothetical protein K435DRAFT_869584 [Dendrothele bispora CBS 962.96]
MSWASSRKTTRPEDMAYCLMGIFGVNMPPIYGEGEAKAFMRLQQEIIKWSDDYSIFAWVAPSEDHKETRGLFARSPSEFRLSGEVGISKSNATSFSFGNNGLRIHLPLIPQPHLGEDMFVARLSCCTRDDQYIGLYLRKKLGQQYVRHRPDDIPLIDKASLISSPGTVQEIVVQESSTHQHRRTHSFYSEDIILHIKLCSPEITVVQFDRHEDFEFRFDANTNTWSIRVHGWSPRWGFKVLTRIKCRTRAGEQFDISVQVFHDAATLSEGRAVQLGHIADDEISPSIGSATRDRHISHLENCDALVSSALYRTGDACQHILEVDYLPSQNSIFKFLHHIERNAELKCTNSDTLNLMIVRSNKRLRHLGSQEVFPSPLSKKYFGMYGDLCYISVSTLANEKHCVLGYNYYSWRSLPPIFVVLGLRNEDQRTIPWIDVIVPSSTLRIADVWESYRDSGQRFERRRNGKTIASAALEVGLFAIASIENRTHLQRGEFNIKIDIEERLELGEINEINTGEKWAEPLTEQRRTGAKGTGTGRRGWDWKKKLVTWRHIPVEDNDERDVEENQA